MRVISSSAGGRSGGGQGVRGEEALAAVCAERGLTGVLGDAAVFGVIALFGVTGLGGVLAVGPAGAAPELRTESGVTGLAAVMAGAPASERSAWGPVAFAWAMLMPPPVSGGAASEASEIPAIGTTARAAAVPLTTSQGSFDFT